MRKKFTLKNRIIALALCLLLVVSSFPSNVLAEGLLSSGVLVVDSGNNEGTTETSVIGRTATISSVFPFLWSDPTNVNSQVSVSASALPASVVIVGVHQFSESTTLYKIDAAEGYTWPEEYADYHYIESTKVTLDEIQTPDTDPTEESTTETTAPSVGGTTISNNGVSVTGNLPEGATLTASDLSASVEGADGIGIYDIKVMDGENAWQPAPGETVKVSIPVTSGATTVDVIHFLEDAAKIKYAVDNGLAKVLDLDALNANDTEKNLLASAILGYQQAYDTSDQKVAVECFYNVAVQNSIVEVNATGFSIYIVNDNGHYDEYSSYAFGSTASNVYMTRGESMSFIWSAVSNPKSFSYGAATPGISSNITKPSISNLFIGTLTVSIASDATAGETFTITDEEGHSVTFHVISDVEVTDNSVMIAILQEEDAAIPPEPNNTSASFYHYTFEGELVTSQTNYLDTNTGFVREDLVENSGDILEDPDSDIYGIVDTTGANKTLQYLNMSEDMMNDIIREYLTLTNGNDTGWENYKLIVYVIKYQNNQWHIDGKVVSRNTYTLSYDYNPPSGFTAYDLSAGTMPSPQIVDVLDGVPTTASVASGAGLQLEAHVENATRTASFVGWSTDPNADPANIPATPVAGDTWYAAGEEITLSDDVILYAIWSLGNFNYSSSDIEFRKVVLYNDEDRTPADDDMENYIFTVEGIASGKTYNYRIYNPSGLLDSSGVLSSAANTFELKNGWFIRIEDVDNGIYNIVETAKDNYTPASGSNTVTLDFAAINPDGEEIVTFTNLKDVVYAITYYDGNSPSTQITPNPEQYKIGETFTLPSADEITKKGHTLQSWKCSDTDCEGCTAEIPMYHQPGSTFTMPADNVEMYAVWSVNSYTIKFVDEDGTELSSADYDYGTAAANIAKPADPTKAANAQYTYTFAGWSPAVANVSGDATYTATYSSTVNTYTVTWLNEDDSELEKDASVPYGTVPTYNSANPTKTATAQYTYTFAGWDVDNDGAVDIAANAAFPAVQGNATYKAVFTPTVNEYTITFVDEDGTTELYSKVYKYGETPVYAGETPTKAADAQYTYTFAGWDAGNDGKKDELASVTGTATYKAIYTAVTNEYTVTWVNYDGEELQSGKVAYGVMPEYTEDIPERAADAQYTYTFAGWDPAVDTVKKDIIYTATYSTTLNKYTIQFVNDDGSVLQSGDVAYGETPVYSGDTPTKAATAQYTFTFAGWSPTISKVTGEATYTATYTETVNKYTVTWADEDGTVLETDKDVPYGTTPTYDGGTPTKAATAQYTYTFTGWDKEVKAVTGNVTYKAEFEQSTNEYTITWVDGNGNTLKTESLAYDTTPQYTGATPTKTATAQYTYTFTGWSPEITSVTGDATYTAQFIETVNTYTVTWKDENGTVLETDSNVSYGTTPSFDGATPTKAATAQYTYTFDGWTPTVSAVTGDATYTATYGSTVNEYTITWIDGDGETLKTEQVAYGQIPSYSGETPTKTSTAQYDYTFKNTWSPAIESVTEAATYTAQFDSTMRTYTVTWENYDGTVLETDNDVPYGQKPSYNGTTPSKASTAEWHFIFAGWASSGTQLTDTTIVEGNVTFTAQYNYVKQIYDVTWYNWNDDLLYTSEDVEFGQYPVYGGDEPTRPDAGGYSYEFDKWSPTVSPVAGNDSYKAWFTQSIIDYSIQYTLGEGTVSGNPDTYTVETDTFTLINPTPNQPYYEFTGWTGSNGDDPQTNVTIQKGSTGDLSYIANYALIDYTITFDTNGADEASLAPDTYTYGENVNLPVVHKTGYTYVWKAQTENGNWSSGEEVSSGTLNKYGDVTLKAEWTPITYSIQFNKNAEDADGTMADLSMTYDSAKKLTANAFEREGYSFRGWSETPDGDVKYDDQESVNNLTSTDGGTVTLYAVWEMNTFNLIIKTVNSIDDNQSYIFKVTGTTVDNKTVTLTVAMGANDEQKIVDLPAGVYVIEDQGGWSWRYDSEEQTKTVYNDAVADFNYTYQTIKTGYGFWLNGYGNERIKQSTKKGE